MPRCDDPVCLVDDRCRLPHQGRSLLRQGRLLHILLSLRRLGRSGRQKLLPARGRRRHRRLRHSQMGQAGKRQHLGRRGYSGLTSTPVLRS